KEDIVDSYNNATAHLDFPQIEAGLTRHALDFLWGINLSRALTLALERAKGFWTLSVGRVQGPTLNLLEEREKEIGKFVPELFWTIELSGKVNGEEILANHEEDKFWEKESAEKVFKKCDGKGAKVKSVEKKMVKQLPPIPFDLTTLQRESYKNFGYSPKMTLDVAQTLYERAVISYPRTSSQKLPQKLGLRKIIEKLGKHRTYGLLTEKLLAKPKLVPNEGKKADAAHPSIFPTGNLPKNLTQYQQRVYDLIVRRFLSTFADPALREHITAVIDSEGENYKAFGMRTVKPNWMEFYGRYAKFKEQILPEMHEGDKIDDTNLSMDEKETSPPNRFSQASVLKAMEDRNLGTKATRAQILHTLYEREYIKEKSIRVTSLGSAVAEALAKHCPDIISEELTKRFDKEMEMIQEGNRKREEVVASAKDELGKILVKFKEHELHIGNELKEGVKEFQETANYIGVCKKCGGELRMIRSHTTHKHFVGCSGYPKCSNSFPLPQKGKLRVGGEVCKICGLNIVEVK
ncbi:MAG: DNA topoisomerase I, partial [Candidatus Aenigmarchaeota archaeon]|nr:DNA topoisomerase I [Candidatus Aenigmarchaeota archaeon]